MGEHDKIKTLILEYLIYKGSRLENCCLQSYNNLLKTIDSNSPDLFLLSYYIKHIIEYHTFLQIQSEILELLKMYDTK